MSSFLIDSIAWVARCAFTASGSLSTSNGRRARTTQDSP